MGERESETFQFRISGDDSGRRVDDFLASRFGGLSRMRLANVVASGACLVNHVAAQSGQRLSSGDEVEIQLDLSTPTSMSPEPIPLEIVHEDDHMLVVVKPAGLLVHPTRHVKHGTLANALAHHLNRLRTADCGLRIDLPTECFDHSGNPQSKIPNPQSTVRPGIVHRLDRATSGLMVVAKTGRALTVLWRHFARRLVEKRYLALVHGEVSDDAGTIAAPIGRDENQRPRWRVLGTGKHAETRFRIVERIGNNTLLELEPVTGRTNQLRIHCAHVGHPIVGDEIYSDCGLRIAECGLRDSSAAPESAIGNPQSAIPRLCLHACRLAFHHPATGEWMEFRSELPLEIKSLLEVLR